MTQLLTAAEVAALLRVDLETVRRRTRRRELPAINIGAGRKPVWRYDALEISRWLDERTTGRSPLRLSEGCTTIHPKIDTHRGGPHEG